ncbi:MULTISPECIES: hypothetical protein [Streptomycetaceae]|uniref:Integral membrane protein n=1 Tax=Streptantibioticus cattleyicolor (strain ATCC 35852 / DSM 46488 / JCM 4925 / NBRC 14057 / NRRL 8057) TaxID=1003195 RepID=F8JWU7_STREN|nr:hypothetical protein [Streptantibioticus cattleyicolor]AEW97106.1 hypothetical protein SCATT_47350 [Streptantibioticus cattleyicolor NRRL 8057 = DSM 46488]MYS61565.1 hypothetical protein [Streptomyces sp. SID5468]CCB77429.1 membrane protein of unknown function [Streptantibioticus cattleyicolor NRRL 8057 = DSM 46488]
MSSFVRPFLPWIGYAVVASVADWRWGALAGLVLTAWGLVTARRAGRGWDALLIETCSAGYFAVVLAIALADPHSVLRPWTQSASSGWLALIAWGSLAVRRPFTLGIARASVPAALWDNPLFRRVNVVISAVWAVAFTCSALALAALQLSGAPGIAPTLVTIAAFVLPAVFTVRYPDAVRARATRQPAV